MILVVTGIKAKHLERELLLADPYWPRLSVQKKQQVYFKKMPPEGRQSIWFQFYLHHL